MAITYRDTIPAFALGRRVNMEEWNTFTRTKEGAAALGFGVPVMPGTGAHSCVELDATNGRNVLGITEASQVLPHVGDTYNQYDNVGICEVGVIGVMLYETRFPDWDFGRLIYVDTTGPAWSPGILTYTSDLSGRANWQSGYAKDVPLADVSQDMQTKTFHLAAIGYQWNIEEINTAIQIQAPLPDRRARAARLAYTKFMYDLTLFGSAEKGLGGITNYPGVTVVVAPADGTGGARRTAGGWRSSSELWRLGRRATVGRRYCEIAGARRSAGCCDCASASHGYTDPGQNHPDTGAGIS